MNDTVHLDLQTSSYYGCRILWDGVDDGRREMNYNCVAVHVSDDHHLEEETIRIYRYDARSVRTEKTKKHRLALLSLTCSDCCVVLHHRLGAHFPNAMHESVMSGAPHHHYHHYTVNRSVRVRRDARGKMQTTQGGARPRNLPFCVEYYSWTKVSREQVVDPVAP